jgi:formylglycine-generating enzyme required for sulfatase activity
MPLTTVTAAWVAVSVFFEDTQAKEGDLKPKAEKAGNRVKLSAVSNTPDAVGKQMVMITLEIDEGWRILANPVENKNFVPWQTVASFKPTVKPVPVQNAEEQPAQAQPKDPPKNFTNSIGMKFVWIPPGSFMMGSPKEEQERKDNETEHKVTLTKGFYMSVCAVTQEQWQEVMGNNRSFFAGEKNLPVEEVSWVDCQDFIKKLREKDKKGYRLPTEAEWEYSCRAGSTTPFHFGDDKSKLGEFAWHAKNSEKTTHPVGQKKPNPWGLHDMHGNVSQWCEDWYGDYPEKDVVDPQGPANGKYHVLRGGSWRYDPGYCRSAYRDRFEPDGFDAFCGFRLCFFEDTQAKEGDPKPKAEKAGNRVKLSAASTTPDADGNQTVTITLAIDKGWRILANPVENKNFVPWQTIASLKPTVKPVSLEIQYPHGKLFTDPLVPEAVCRYYDDKVEIRALLQRSPGDNGPIDVEVVFVATDGETTLFSPRRLRVEVP